MGWALGTEGEKANVLGATDLDSLHVELAVMNHRTALNVRKFIHDRILFRMGTLATIHSDHAQELIGSVMTQPTKTFGYINTNVLIMIITLYFIHSSNCTN